VARALIGLRHDGRDETEGRNKRDGGFQHLRETKTMREEKRKEKNKKKKRKKLKIIF
jgi:hypothetical protein